MSTSSSDPFAGADPNLIVSQMKQLSMEDHEPHPKPFYSSYPAWDKMNLSQKTKATKYFTQLKTDVRDELIASAQQFTETSALQAKHKQAFTNKHDRARVLHLRADPKLTSLWTAALREKTRVELDGGADPWGALAEEFNDYETYQ